MKEKEKGLGAVLWDKMKKHPLQTGIIVTIMVLLIISAYLGSRYLIHESFIKSYQQGNYDTSKEEKLLVLNLNDPYLPYYHMGNAAYQKGEYRTAENMYFKALENNPPHSVKGDLECEIRINLALSFLARINYDNLQDPNEIEKTRPLLLSARFVLVEEDCASAENDNGHHEDAEQLKKEIDDLLNRLENQENPPQEDPEKNPPPPKEEEEKDSDDEKQDKQSKEMEDKVRKQLEDSRGKSDRAVMKQKQKSNKRSLDDILNDIINGDSDPEYKGDRW